MDLWASRGKNAPAEVTPVEKKLKKREAEPKGTLLLSFFWRIFQEFAQRRNADAGRCLAGNIRGDAWFYCACRSCAAEPYRSRVTAQRGSHHFWREVFPPCSSANLAHRFIWFHEIGHSNIVACPFFPDCGTNQGL